MDPIQKEVAAIGEGIRQLREHLGFSKRFVSVHCGLTSETVGSIEKGRGFNHDSIGKLAHFFGMTISELTDYNRYRQIPPAVREEVVQYLLTDMAVSADRLKEEIGPKTVIGKWLRDSNYFSFPRRVRDVKIYIKDTFGLKYTSPTVSQALINAKKEGVLKRIPINKKDFYYLDSNIVYKPE